MIVVATTTYYYYCCCCCWHTFFSRNQKMPTSTTTVLLLNCAWQHVRHKCIRYSSMKAETIIVVLLSASTTVVVIPFAICRLVDGSRLEVKLARLSLCATYSSTSTILSSYCIHPQKPVTKPTVPTSTNYKPLLVLLFQGARRP